MLVPDGARAATERMARIVLVVDHVGQKGAHRTARQDRLVDDRRVVSNPGVVFQHGPSLCAYPERRGTASE